MITQQDIQNWTNEYLNGTDYELITLTISPENEILVEVDRLAGVDVEFCAALNHFLVEKLGDEDYSLEVGSVSLTDPFKTKMQFEKNLGHDVEVMAQGDKGQGVKYRGQLVAVDDDTFSIEVEEKVVVEGKKKKQLQMVTYTWRYDEPEYVKYDLKF